MTTKNPMRRTDPGVYETPDEKYAAFKSNSGMWAVSGNGRNKLAFDLKDAQKIVARWVTEDTQ